MAQTKVVAMPVDDAFQPANLRWNNATAGGYDALIALKAVGGQIHLCGIGSVTNAQLRAAIRKALRGGSLKINGKTVVKNFSYFATASNSSQLKSSKANCQSTGLSTSTSINDVQFNYGDGTFRN